MTLKVEVIPAKELSQDLISAWSRVQKQNPALDSCYFRPEFVRIVAQVRNDVEVAVIHEAGEPAGFFPFQRSKWNIGMPVGGKLSDFQAIIAPRNFNCSGEELVRRCQLSTWQFDHLLATPSPFSAFQHEIEPSPYINLSHGFDEYCRQRKAAGSQVVQRIRKKIRKIEREVGPLRFEMNDLRRETFDQLLEWKTEQYRQTDVVNTFQFDWVVGLLDRIRQTQSEDFSGMLSTLHAGDHLIALHLGMQTSQVLHCWFPTFSRAFGKYSPGLIFLLRLAEAAAAKGCQRIDLGKGPERYKYSFASGETQVASGAVDCNTGFRTVRGLWRGLKRAVNGSPLSTLAKKPAWLLHKARQRYLFQ